MFVALLFYRSFIATLPMMLLSIPLHKFYARYRIEKRRTALLDSFRDVLYSISSSVSAGKKMPTALEDACLACEGDMRKELLNLTRDYREAHADIAKGLKDFGERSGVAEIKQFADSYGICEKCGADLEGVCLKSASLLLDRIDYQNEIKMLVAQKKLDVILLTLMPPAVLLFLNLSSYAYVQPLYNGFPGRAVMTLCLALIASALLWGMKIINLKL
jgi:tight adherence protein B